MGKFLTKLVISKIHGKHIYIVDELFKWKSNDGLTISVPAGFRTDLGSIPVPFRWYVTPDERDLIKAFILHDFCYAQNNQHHLIDSYVLNREQADRYCLLEAAADNGEHNLIKRYIIYSAVRMFGWLFWD